MVEEPGDAGRPGRTSSMDAVAGRVRVSRGGANRVATPQQALALIADKWAVLVITTLDAGPRRYNALRRDLDGVSQKMLTQTLRDLECNGLVARTVYPDAPPRVEYALTPLGLTLVEALTALRDWAAGHFHEVEAARSRYCAGGDADESPATQPAAAPPA